jgi:hypothetical protein
VYVAVLTHSGNFWILRPIHVLIREHCLMWNGQWVHKGASFSEDMVPVHAKNERSEDDKSVSKSFVPVGQAIAN